MPSTHQDRFASTAASRSPRSSAGAPRPRPPANPASSRRAAIRPAPRAAAKPLPMAEPARPRPPRLHRRTRQPGDSGQHQARTARRARRPGVRPARPDARRNRRIPADPAAPHPGHRVSCGQMGSHMPRSATPAWMSTTGSFAARPAAVIGNAIRSKGSHGPPGRSDVPVTLRPGAPRATTGFPVPRRSCQPSPGHRPVSSRSCDTARRQRQTDEQDHRTTLEKGRDRAAPAALHQPRPCASEAGAREKWPPRRACGERTGVPGGRKSYAAPPGDHPAQIPRKASGHLRALASFTRGQRLGPFHLPVPASPGQPG